jgi:hypothetical protein
MVAARASASPMRRERDSRRRADSRHESRFPAARKYGPAHQHVRRGGAHGVWTSPREPVPAPGKLKSAQILKGAKPTDLPLSSAVSSTFINLKTAKALGLTIPPSLLRTLPSRSNDATDLVEQGGQ